jgi:hypothetical protein
MGLPIFLVKMIDLREANRSTVYLLPLVGRGVTYDKIKPYYVNTYLSGIEGFKVHNPLYLVLNYEDTDGYNNTEQLLTQSVYYVDYKELNEKQTVYAFDIPEEHYTKFLNGKYSEFTPQFKDSILTFYKLNFHHPDNLLLLILRKDRSLKHLHMKNLGCIKDGGCKCVIDTYPEQVKQHGTTSVTYHVDECPSYIKCKYYKVPVKESITDDAELDDIPDFNKETYES